MGSSRIEEMKRKRMNEYKTKRSQKRSALVVLFIVVLFFAGLWYMDVGVGWTWLIGLLIGFTLQRSKFCFTAGFRDPVLVGSTSVLRAIVIALMIMTVGFAVFHMVTGSEPSQVDPVGLNTAFGAVLFGIGMVVAGGCASGTLMRIGEGFKLQLVVLLGFVIGSSLSAGTFETWDNLLMRHSLTIYIPDIIGVYAAVALQLLLLLSIYNGLKKYDQKNSMLVE